MASVMSLISTEILQSPTINGPPHPRRRYLFAAAQQVMANRYFIKLRFATLRLLCLSSLSVMIISIHTRFIYSSDVISGTGGSIASSISIAISSIAFVRHLASAFGPRISLPRILDLALVLVELAGTVNFILAATSLLRQLRRVSGGILVLEAVYHNMEVLKSILGITLLVFLHIATLLRLIDLTMKLLEEKRTSKCLWERYDISWQIELQQNQLQSQWKPSSARVLLGDWRRHLPGEGSWIIYTRGLVSVLFILAVICFGVFTIVIQPLHNLDGFAVRESRETWEKVLRDVTKSPNSTDVHVVLVYTGPQVSQDDFKDAVKLMVRDFELSYIANVTSKEEACHHEKPALTLANGLGGRNFAAFRCRVEDFGSTDILVNINYTQGMQSTVQALIGFEPIELTLSTSPGITLRPGVRLVGEMKMYVRRSLKSKRLTVLDIFDTYVTTLALEISQLWSDPLRPAPNEDPESKGVSSLRLSFQEHITLHVEVMQDYRDKSIFNGFATLGGFSTFLAGIFSAIFGTSIFKILFGIKPLSVYGLAHWLPKLKMRDACIAEYPRITQDLQNSPEDRGLLSFIHDHLLDMDFSESSKKSKVASPPDIETSKNAPVIPLEVLGGEFSHGSKVWTEETMHLQNQCESFQAHPL